MSRSVLDPLNPCGIADTCTLKPECELFELHSQAAHCDEAPNERHCWHTDTWCPHDDHVDGECCYCLAHIPTE